MGVSSAISKRNVTPQTLIRTADEALYEAKRQGRNRINIKNIEYDTVKSGH